VSSQEASVPLDNAFDADEALTRLAHEMSAPPFHDVLRPEPVVVKSDGSVVVRLPFRPEFRRGCESPFYHGGVIASLVDIAAHAAIAVRVGRMVPTIDLRIDYLRAAPEGELLATGRALTVGRSIARADAEIRDKNGKLVAVGRGAFSTRAD
jgi:uncharacterized protein (TIGR00369 family)